MPEMLLFRQFFFSSGNAESTASCGEMVMHEIGADIWKPNSRLTHTEEYYVNLLKL